MSKLATVVEEEEKFTVVSRREKKSPAKRNVTISSLTSSSIPCTRGQQRISVLLSPLVDLDTISVRRWCYIKMHILLCYANCIILPLKSAFPLSRKFS